MAPNKEVIEKWVEALESGEYQQATGALRREAGTFESGGFCCLGVLCELAVAAEVIPPPRRDFDWTYGGLNDTPRTGGLPESVVAWSGLPNGDPGVEADWRHPECEEGDRFIPTLSDLNDDAKFDFNQIAQVIRSNFL